MINLTGRHLTLARSDGENDIELPRNGPVARALVNTGARPTEETTDRGAGPVRTLRLAGPTRHQVARLNELIAEHVRLDRTVGSTTRGRSATPTTACRTRR